MKKSIACIVYSQEKNKIFIAKRMPIGKMGGKWEFPGGKLEADEDAETAIIREMQEEFSVNVSVGTKVGETTFFHFDDQVLLEAYEVSFEHDGIEKKFMLTEHTEYKWVDIESIKDLDFVDSDLKIYPTVLSYIKGKYQK